MQLSIQTLPYLTFLAQGAIGALTGAATVNIVDYLRNLSRQESFPGICAEKIKWLQPLKPMFRQMGRYIHLPVNTIGLTPRSISRIACVAIEEEIVCRGLIQKVLLRSLQFNLLKTISSNHETLVDHPIAKMTRIAAASLIFGLLHTRVWECKNGGTIPEMAAGLIFGTLAETRYGLSSAIIAHITADLIIYQKI